MRTVEEILARYEKSNERQQLWRNTLKEAYEIAFPERNTFDSGSEGQDKTQGLYDSSGIIAANSFVSTMMRLLFPPDTPFAKIAIGPLVPEESRADLQELLDIVNAIHYNSVKASNFYREIVPFLYDLFVGTAVFSIQSGDLLKPFRHKAIPIDQIAFEEDCEGEVNSVYRLWTVNADDVLQKWPRATFAQNKSTRTKVEILENIYFDYDSKKWIYAVVEKKEQKIIFSDKNYTYNAMHIARWASTSGEINGRGPLLQAVSEFRLLNRLKYFASESLPFRVFPILTTTDSDALDPDKFVLEPGVLNLVESNSGPSGPSIQALNYGGDVKYEQYQIEEIKYNIKKLTLDEQMPSAAGPVKSATEWMARVNEIRQDRAVAFSKIQHEAIKGIFLAQIHVLYKLGAFPKDFYKSFKLEDLNEFVLKISIESPVAKQNKMEEAQQALLLLQTMKATNEQAASLVVDEESLFEDIALTLGIEAKYVRNKSERALIKQAQSEYVEQMQNQDAMRDVEKEVLINETKQR